MALLGDIVTNAMKQDFVLCMLNGNLRQVTFSFVSVYGIISSKVVMQKKKKKKRFLHKLKREGILASF